MIKSKKSGGTMQRIAALLLGIAALVYAIYHIASLFGEEITTVPSGISAETTVVDTTGYVFRDEKLLFSENGGVADYIVSDGSRVAIGDKVAQVHVSGEQTSKTLLRVLDNKISVLERSTGAGLTLADLPEVNDDISDAYYALTRMLAEGDTGSISKQTDKLLTSMNKHSMLTDENSPVEDTLASLVKQRDGILKNGGESVLERAEESGYFYSYVDGYEDYFTISAADEITEKSFYELTSMKSPKIAENVYGKLSDSFEWRFVVNVSALEKNYFKVGQTYELKFTENGNTVIPMTLQSEVADKQGGGKILVFSANRLPDGFVFNRCQCVSIEVNSISGIYLSLCSHMP